MISSVMSAADAAVVTECRQRGWGIGVYSDPIPPYGPGAATEGPGRNMTSAVGSTAVGGVWTIMQRMWDREYNCRDLIGRSKVQHPSAANHKLDPSAMFGLLQGHRPDVGRSQRAAGGARRAEAGGGGEEEASGGVQLRPGPGPYNSCARTPQPVLDRGSRGRWLLFGVPDGWSYTSS